MIKWYLCKWCTLHYWFLKMSPQRWFLFWYKRKQSRKRDKAIPLWELWSNGQSDSWLSIHSLCSHHHIPIHLFQWNQFIRNASKKSEMGKQRTPSNSQLRGGEVDSQKRRTFASIATTHTHPTHQLTKDGPSRRLSLHVGALALRKVVVALYPNVLDASLAAGRRGSTWTQRTGEQVFDLLQLEALRLRQAAQDEGQA